MIRALVVALLLAPAVACAQTSPPLTSRAYPSGTSPQDGGIPGGVTMWFDSAAVTPWASGGAPRAASREFPLPTAGRGPGTPTQTSVAVPAGASTALIAANPARRSLQVIPSNTSCTVNQAGGAASSSSMPIPGGWSWTETDPPPATAVTAYCATAATLSVTETK